MNPSSDDLTPNVTPPPRSSAVSPEPGSKLKPTVYALQVRAFLDASEDVGIDEETLQDILEGISEDCVEIGVQVDCESDGGEDEDLDISALFDFKTEAELAWTKQEVKGMMHHLKEHGETAWIKEYVIKRNHPIPKLLYAFGICLCKELRQKQPKTLLYFLRVALSRELHLRDRLISYNTMEDAVNLIRNSERIVILTGAGISVSCGIPDFRSRDGLYATLKDRGDFDLDDPQQMFDIHYFKENPSVFYSFANQIYPSNFTPSPCHRFIKIVEDRGKLLRNYTQNIDTLETLAGVKRVLQCHGSFATATCLQCRRCVDGTKIEQEILEKVVPLCSVCKAEEETKRPSASQKKTKRAKTKKKGGWDSEEEDESDSPEYPPWIMKPDITFFGEKLNDKFEHSLLEDRENVDLLIVIGTSLKVSPVSDILSYLPHSVPQILINKTPVKHINPDIILLGDADEIVLYLCDQLSWELPLASAHLQLPRIKKRPSADIIGRSTPQRVGKSHVWLFEGAEGGKWLQEFALQDNENPDEAESDGAEGDIGLRWSKKARVTK